jgi:hypothetical protein
MKLERIQEKPHTTIKYSMLLRGYDRDKYLFTIWLLMELFQHIPVSKSVKIIVNSAVCGVFKKQRWR